MVMIEAARHLATDFAIPIAVYFVSWVAPVVIAGVSIWALADFLSFLRWRLSR